LILANCKLTDDDLKTLSASKSIQVLSLSGNTKITDAGVKHLKKMQQLQWLVLTGTSVTKKSLETLLSMRNLKRLEMISTHCSERESAEIESALKQARPGFKFDKQEVAPQDTKLTMPEFPWIGPGLHTHLDEMQVNRELERGFGLDQTAN
jgi:hypothetical protein